MKNIHIVPTDKPSRLGFDSVKNLHFVNDFINDYQNIYITNDEEIKIGDWFLPQGHINPHKLKGYNKINGDLESYNGLCYDISKCKKIILTTDADLINDGVQAIPDEFLEWFVKNPSCEWVEVISNSNYEMLYKVGASRHKIIIPKEEPNLDKHLASLPEYPGPRRSAFVSKQETLEDKFQSWNELIKKLVVKRNC